MKTLFFLLINNFIHKEREVPLHFASLSSLASLPFRLLPTPFLSGHWQTHFNVFFSPAFNFLLSFVPICFLVCSDLSNFEILFLQISFFVPVLAVSINLMIALINNVVGFAPINFRKKIGRNSFVVVKYIKKHYRFLHLYGEFLCIKINPIILYYF